MLRNHYPHILASVYIVLFILLGINPTHRDLWIIEILPAIIIFFCFVFTYKKFKFSNYAYSMMFFWLVWHLIGAHYSFSEVPFSIVTETFNFERNHFDRVGHFGVGFYAFGAAELIIRKKWAHPILAVIFGFFFVLSIAASYEIVEWLFADIVGGDTGAEFLGSQGDIWDAQKDMLADGLGAIFALLLFWKLKARILQNKKS